MYEELAADGLMIITVALDRSADDIRSYIEDAKPGHPSLIDTEHVLAELYSMINIPTVVWIDEEGTIVRPNEPAFGSDMFKDFHGQDPEVHKNELRAWVGDEVGAIAKPVTSDTERCWYWTLKPPTKNHPEPEDCQPPPARKDGGVGEVGSLTPKNTSKTAKAANAAKISKGGVAGNLRLPDADGDTSDAAQTATSSGYESDAARLAEVPDVEEFTL